MKRFMNISEAREVCQKRGEWRSIISAFPNGNLNTSVRTYINLCAYYSI